MVSRGAGCKLFTKTLHPKRAIASIRTDKCLVQSLSFIRKSSIATVLCLKHRCLTVKIDYVLSAAVSAVVTLAVNLHFFTWMVFAVAGGAILQPVFVGFVGKLLEFSDHVFNLHANLFPIGQFVPPPLLVVQ